MSFKETWAKLTKTPSQGSGDTSPFSIAGTRGGIVCLHGLTGTPFEVRPLGESLGKEGYAVVGPVLAGHAQTPEALVKTGWQDWLASANEALDRVLATNNGRPAGVVGFSTGGLLALRLAKQRPQDVAAFAVVATPLRMKASQVRGIRWLNKLPDFMVNSPLGYVPKWGGPDVQDPAMKSQNPGLPVMPLPALNRLLDLMQVVRADLPSIKQPALVAHGQKDETIPLEDSLEIAGSLGSEDVERLWLARSGHLAGIDLEKHVLAQALAKFFARHLPGN
ncbi:MAG: alpha/beta fold hydrolase [Deltaproteobacteria bacterium]|nr:alpha/beta fold hydrolase [Deltaproteobacteria bacterium]